MSTGDTHQSTRFAAFAAVAILAVLLGDKLTSPDDAYRYVAVESRYDRSDGMTIHLQKTGGDSEDLNVDGGVMVKHGKDYTDTPGYSDTLQLYTLAGSAGTIVGNNNYVGSGGTPYAPPEDAQPNGFIRFELGPLWPRSEKMRLNNSGDLILGWETRSEGTFSQAGRTVTGAGFTPDMVGDYVVRTGTRATADRIVRFVDSETVIVETARTFGPELGQVWSARIVLRPDAGSLAIDGAELFVEDGALMFRGGGGTVTTIAPD